jgi:GAF domain-containing protein
VEAPREIKGFPASITAQMMEIARVQTKAGVAGNVRKAELAEKSYLEALKRRGSAKWSLESILDSIAEAAQRLTSADGAALALGENGKACCRARSGELSPPIGTPLVLDSGISAECLHTGRVLRSDDTLCDERVDQEVCRALGIRSVAVAPVQGAQETVGILEIFSRNTRAFNDRDMAHLRLLAATAAAECRNHE